MLVHYALIQNNKLSSNSCLISHNIMSAFRKPWTSLKIYRFHIWTHYLFYTIGITNDWPWMIMDLSTVGPWKHDSRRLFWNDTYLTWRSICHIERINQQNKTFFRHANPSLKLFHESKPATVIISQYKTMFTFGKGSRSCNIQIRERISQSKTLFTYSRGQGHLPSVQFA